MSNSPNTTELLGFITYFALPGRGSGFISARVLLTEERPRTSLAEDPRGRETRSLPQKGSLGSMAHMFLGHFLSICVLGSYGSGRCTPLRTAPVAS